MVPAEGLRETLARLLALALAASPGPWSCDDGNVFSIPRYTPRREALKHNRLSSGPRVEVPEDYGFVTGGQSGNDNYDADSEFIVAMRNSLDVIFADLAHLEEGARLLAESDEANRKLVGLERRLKHGRDLDAWLKAEAKRLEKTK